MERAKTKELEATEQGTSMVQAAKEEADKKVEAADKRAENAEQARAHLQVLLRGILNEAEAARRSVEEFEVQVAEQAQKLSGMEALKNELSANLTTLKTSKDLLDEYVAAVEDRDNRLQEYYDTSIALQAELTEAKAALEEL